MESIVSYRLDLVVRLVDTTVGCPVTQRQVSFWQNGQEIVFLPREAGTYVLVNAGRKDGKLAISVRGYLQTAVDICYGKLAERYPEVYVELIPERPKYGNCDFADISGNLPGISSVAAVCLTNPSARALSYNAKKQRIRLLQAKELDEKAYALIHAQAETFEEFRVASAGKKLLLRLEHPLETELKPEEAIARIVRGRTEENGDYLLRLRRDGQGMRYLVRYEVKGKVTFEKITAAAADSRERGAAYEKALERSSEWE